MATCHVAAVRPLCCTAALRALALRDPQAPTEPLIRAGFLGTAPARASDALTNAMDRLLSANLSESFMMGDGSHISSHSWRKAVELLAGPTGRPQDVPADAISRRLVKTSRCSTAHTSAGAAASATASGIGGASASTASRVATRVACDRRRPSRWRR